MSFKIYFKKPIAIMLCGIMVMAGSAYANKTEVEAAEDISTYSISIPATLDVKNSGWNETTGISATGTLESGKKLIVTASSANSWKLKSGDNSVGYTLTTAEGGSQTTTWEFTELSSTATKKDMGIIVNDYSNAAPGNYTDTVTFSASITDATVAVTGIALDKTTLELTAGGDTATLTATVEPNTATDKTVTWTSSNESVATVENGVVTPVAAGTATITAKAGDKEATCAITVKASTIAVTSIVIDNAPTEALFVNSTGTLTATVLPDNATDKTVTWSSSDPDYVKIDANTGEYTIMGTKGYGSATITATAGDKTATCTITGKVTYTSLSAGTVLHVGDTFYAGKVYFNTKPSMSFNESNGVITVVEDNGYYKFQRGSNGTKPNVTSYKVKDNTDGVYIFSGSGTSTSDRFVLAVHNVQ